MEPSEKILQATRSLKQPIQDALKAHYLRGTESFHETEAGQKALFEHTIRRTRFCARVVIPWIKMFRDLRDTRMVEIGGGTGAFTNPFAAECKEVHTYEISEDATRAAKARAEILGTRNIVHHCAEPEQIIDAMTQENEGQAGLVLLFATLEHQTIAERLASLRAAWRMLSEEGILVVGGTPNRLVFCDTHTARMPFYGMLPDELAVHFVDQSPNKRFAKAVKHGLANGSLDDVRLLIDRWGRGVSFHEFEVAYGDLRPLTIAHGFESPWYRRNPLSLEERLLIRYFREMQFPVPLGFARQNLQLILQKRAGKETPEPRWDEDFDPDAVL